MAADDAYYSIERERASEIKIKRSIFICRMSPAASLEEAKAFIARISKENKKATHNCWAYILGEGGLVLHSSDAGEPPGTAGRPMLGMLQKYEMTDVAAVVTRYFGGVKLGVKGLMEAYAQSVAETLEAGPRIRWMRTVPLLIEAGYDINDVLINQLGNLECRIKDSTYTSTVAHKVLVDQGNTHKIEDLLTNYQNQGLLTFKWL